ncbi:MAG: hypothetical protein ACYSTL_04140 [Planctomycetota bacterium]|jgi:hypothetical protein
MKPLPGIPPIGGGNSNPPPQVVDPLRGGGVPQSVPQPIPQANGPPKEVTAFPWDVFVACELNTHKDDKAQKATFAPQWMSTPDEAFQTLRLLIAAFQWEHGPVAWDTVPEEVKKHFRFQDDESDAADYAI